MSRDEIFDAEAHRLMMHRDKVFMEGDSLRDIVWQNHRLKFTGRWDVTILIPQGLSASDAASTVLAAVIWLEEHAEAKTFDLLVASSPDHTWSISLQERIDD
jgi:hypothetical protein